jgi:hypothetical protein
MSSTPRLNRFLFYAFLLFSLTVGTAALIWPQVRGVSYAPLRDALLPNFYINPQAGKAVTLNVAVPPALEGWIRDASADFAKQNPRITVNLIVLRGADAGRRLNGLTGVPDVWIGESDWARVAAGGIPFATAGTTVAQDPFVWVAPAAGRQDVLQGLNWTSLAQIAGRDPQFRLAVPPAGSMEGMGACLSAAANYFQTPSITAGQINDAAFQRQLAGLMDAVPDLSRNPYDQMATRPPQADAAFLPLSDGRRLDGAQFLTQSPQFSAVLNFPYFIRSEWREVADWEGALQLQAAETFRTYLLSAAVQGRLASHRLERAAEAIGSQARPADDNAVFALQFCWRAQGGNS